MKNRQTAVFFLFFTLAVHTFGSELLFTPGDSTPIIFDGQAAAVFSASNINTSISLDMPEISSSGTVGNISFSTALSVSAEPFSNASAVIEELAYALEYNPTNIYEFVRNQIDSEFYVGHKRSPERVLQDGAGNDCDQASLLIALLEASGFGASYNYGAVILPVFENDGYNLLPC